MRYAEIDTESSGLPVYKEASGKPVPADEARQPRLAELAMLLLNEDMSIAEEYRALVRPDGWVMDPGATAVNGLTTDYLLEHGKPVTDVLHVYTQAIKEGFAIAAYAAQFDCKIMRGELRRAGMDDLFMQTKNVCLMRKSQGVIPRPDGKKSWPKLEHCREFLKLPHDGAHRAGADVMSAYHVLRYLSVYRDQNGKGVDLTPTVHFAHGGYATTAQNRERKTEELPS
jgi:DNA polymerase-3 subunit epsilon